MSRNDQRRMRRVALAATLRGVRLYRNLQAAQVARAMNLEIRAYERFEAAEGRLDLDRILDFAEVCRADPDAIIAAMRLEQPGLAVQCADNKLLSIHAISLAQFAQARGDRLRRLEGSTLIEVFEHAYERLGVEQDERDARLTDFLDRKPRDKT